MNRSLRLIVPVLAALLAACGSTSDLKPDAKPETAGAAQNQNIKPGVDLSAYDKVVVLDFVDGTDTSKIKPDQARAHAEMMAADLHTFSDLIASKIRETGAFSQVTRETSPGKALVISGRVTRMTEGSSALRFWVGMGAGSSYFDASVRLTDAETGNVLGGATTDNNSWPLGGALAAGQTVRGFMELSAGKIATRLRDGKQGHPTASTH